MDLFYLFLSQFGAVQVMILSSKLIQNDRVLLAMLNSWLITLTQFAFVYIITTSTYSVPEKIFFSGLGGSLGVGSGWWIYNKFLHKEK